MDKTVISILAGLGGMFGWGTSDFLANSASEKIGAKRAFFWSQIAGLLMVFAITLITQQQLDLPMSLLLKTIYLGSMYALGYLFFYRGFEIGNVSVVSAVINLQVLFIIMITFFVRGQRLSALQVPAIVLLILGIMLVSVNFKELQKGGKALVIGVKETILSAVFFGILFWPYNEVVLEQNNLLWVTVLTKFFALIVVFIVIRFSRQSLTLPKNNKPIWLLVTVVGILEAGAMLSVNFGAQIGDGILVQPISSALTIVTVGLAMIFLKEKISRIQGIGIALTITGIILTAF